jgi:hypothetical protein
MFWKIPKIWPNKTFVLLGGGPSLPKLLEGKKFDKCPVIGINDSFRFGDWVNVCFFGDTKWYWWNKEDLKSFRGLKITCDRMRNPDKAVGDYFGTVKREPEIKVVRHSNSYGICTERSKLFFNSSSGAAAINLAWWLGANRIILLGFDMRLVDGERNWRRHPNFKPGVQKGYKNFLKAFDFIAKDANKLHLEILNATPDSGLKHFPFIKPEKLCKLWTSIKLFIICSLTEQVSLGMVMENLNFV